jgi:peptidoglycan/LPS O-acetylase OafA/YrhL
MLLGMTAMGWNGILLAELGLRAAPTGRTAEAVATGTSFAYLGVLVAPLAFVQLDHALGSKAAALGGLALLAVLAGASLLKGRAQLPNRPSPS